MSPPVREGVGWRKSTVAGGGEMPVPRISIASDASLARVASMAGAAFWLAAAATAVGVLALLLPHSPRLDEAGLAAVTAGAATLAGGALALTRGAGVRG